MSTDKTLAWAYAEDLYSDPAAILTARGQAAQLAVDTVSPAAGHAITALAAATGARTVVEIGTGTGVTSLYLLAGLQPDAILTTIDLEPEHQRVAKEAFAAAGIKPARTRPITGRTLDIVPRLADAAYDLVVLGGDPAFYPEHAEQAHRLLRAGGTLVVTHALWHDGVADPTRRDEPTSTVRAVIKAITEDERFTSSVLPVGDGLLVAVKTA